MPLDAICLQGVVGELAPRLTGSRIEKIQQPARDQVILLLRGSRRLLLNAGAGQPRLHLTEQLRDNPSQPPMFCMLLRKHLSGGVIESIRQEPLERVVTLTVLAADELGERSRFTLVWEGMPRRANLILCDRDGRIIDCLRRIDLEMNQERQVLPGLFYRLPPRQEKRSPLTVTEEEFRALLSRAAPDTPLDGWLLDTFTALPPLVARELTYRACGSTDAPASQGGGLWSVFSRWQSAVNENSFTPTLIKRGTTLSDFTYGPVTQYGAYAETQPYDSFSRLLDDFYEKREQAERVKQYAKAKTAEKYLTAQLHKGREELQYLESVLQELSQAESEQDFNDIRTELTDGGYIRQRGRKQPGFQRASKPREFRTSGGLRVLVGRNNRQNDRLTTRDADKRDIWLHTQKIHGSHVILCTGGAEPDEQSLLEAASLAAYFSQAQDSAKVPVDYTPVRFVKKPAGARPGMVVYTTCQTLLADPDEELVKRLAGK